MEAYKSTIITYLSNSFNRMTDIFICHFRYFPTGFWNIASYITGVITCINLIKFSF